MNENRIYSTGQQFFSDDDKCLYTIIEVHNSPAIGIRYLCQPEANHYVFEEMEYLYPAMMYRESALLRMVSIGYWKEV